MEAFVEGVAALADSWEPRMSRAAAHTSCRGAVNEQLGATPRAARVIARAQSALHLDADGFVVTVLDRRVPLLPNAVAVSTLLESRTGRRSARPSGLPAA